MDFMSEHVNLCGFELMSYCTAGNDWKSQRLCSFFKKATIADHCMHYRKLLGGHCDSVEAQKELRALNT